MSDQPELFQRGFKVVDDFLRDHVGIGEAVGGFKGFVLEPEDVETGLVASGDVAVVLEFLDDGRRAHFVMVRSRIMMYNYFQYERQQL